MAVTSYEDAPTSLSMGELSLAMRRVATARTVRLLPTIYLEQRAPLLCRKYATQTTLGTTTKAAKRKTVTVLNDDGRVPWKDLTAGEKFARSSQQSFNFSLIVVGLVMAVCLESYRHGTSSNDM